MKGQLPTPPPGGGRKGDVALQVLLPMNRPAPDRRPTPFDLSSRSFRHTWSVDKEQGPAWPVVLMANGVGERSREAGILLEGSGGSLPLRAPPCQQESRPQTAGWHSGGIGRRQLIRLSPPLARSVPRSQPKYLTAKLACLRAERTGRQRAQREPGSEDPASDHGRKSSSRLRPGDSGTPGIRRSFFAHQRRSRWYRRALRLNCTVRVSGGSPPSSENHINS